MRTQLLDDRLETENRHLLPEEFLTLGGNAVIEGEKNSKKIMRAPHTTLEGENSTVTVISSLKDPISSLQDLLLNLVDSGKGIHLWLLDSFLNGCSGSAKDSARLKLFMNEELRYVKK